MVIIFIRHADKKYTNSAKCTFAHDSPIQEGQEDRCYNVAVSLMSVFGRPTHIYSSPFLRCRQTSHLLEPHIEPVIDVRIGEFLGHHSHMDVRPETEFHNPIFGENYHIFTRRVEAFCEDIMMNHSRQDVVWVITHGIVLNRINKRMNPRFKNIDRKFDYLEHIVLS